MSSSSFILPPASQTRLVTIVAQVDHGKTTLADNLIESNGIIGERLAGTIRYLDFDSEEQRRGITMRTSTIALKHVYTPPGGKGKKEKESMVLHLLDSPGHVDFAPEVTTSLLLSDTALLVIDVVEGMCARTHSILREAHAHSMKPILIINKMDRLCCDLKLSVRETYLRIRGLLESVNAVCANMVMRSKLERMEREGGGLKEAKKGDEEEDEETTLWTFHPSSNNVVFASALHGWGFTIPSLARHLYKSNLVENVKPMLLKQLLFDDSVKYKHGKILKRRENDEEYNLFEEYALKPMWGIYERVGDAALTAAAIAGNTQIHNDGTAAAASLNKTKITADTPGMEDILSLLQNAHTSTSTSTPQNAEYSILAIPKTKENLQLLLQKTGASNEESICRTLLRRYRPLSNAVLDCVCEVGFNPHEAIQGGWRKDILSLNELEEDENRENNNQEMDRMSMVPALPASASSSVSYPPSFQKAYKDLSTEISQCNPSSSVVMAHVTKFLVTDPSYVTDPKGSVATHNDDSNDKSKKKNIIMGLARVLSGTIHSNTAYHVFGPRYKPAFSSSSSCQTTNPPPTKTIKLYLLMGSSFIQVPSVPAGHICAIYNLEELQYKSVTLCNVYEGMMPFGGGGRGMDQAKRRPLVKVNVEAVSSADTDLLEKGLVKLCLADSAVEVIATSKGERILSCLGEIHLEQSILDLKRTYCRRQKGENGTTTKAESTFMTNGNGKKDNSTEEDTIELRISEPIVEFGESTTWFDKECKSSNEYTKFWKEMDKDSSIIQPVRQVTIPPYCDEEGLKYAKRGRSRCILSGRCAALSVRVVPLSRRLYDCLRLKNVTATSVVENENDEDTGGGGGEASSSGVEDILEMGRALKCTDTTFSFTNGDDESAASNSASAQSILDTLSQSVCHIDSNGNAFIESRGIARGECVKAVLSDHGEVYVSTTTKETTGDSSAATTNNNNMSQMSNGDEKEEGGEFHNEDELDEKDICGKDVYESIRYRIGQGGLMGMADSNIDSNKEEENGDENEAAAADAAALDIWKSEMRGSAVAGFQLAMRAGALCEEPVRGVLVVLEGVEIAMKKKRNTKASKDSTSPSSFQSAKPLSGGMVVAALRSGIRCALLTRPARLVEGHLRLTLHSSFAGLGPLYAVLSKRRGKVISDDMVEGTDLIRITASIPQAESFHLAPELLNESSGEVTAPELVFSHWEVLDEDPFWIPTSLEEREDYGEILMSGDLSTGLDNNALKYIRMVRSRKGLLVDSSKIVVAAEKQRTLARKK